MKNRLSDLNNHLFAQLERLNDENLKGDALQQELERARGISGIARDIINNGNLVLSAQTNKSGMTRMPAEIMPSCIAYARLRKTMHAKAKRT